MGLDGVSPLSNPYARAGAARGSDSSSRANETPNRNVGSSNLSVQDFLNLLASQLQNQDMMNPMKDSEFMTQMAQFSSLQAMSNVADITMTSYASSLVGKEVTVAYIDGMGKLKEKEGTVTGVGFYGGSAYVYLGEDTYALNQIMGVGKMPAKEDPEKPEEPDAGDGTDNKGDDNSTKAP